MRALGASFALGAKVAQKCDHSPTHLPRYGRRWSCYAASVSALLASRTRGRRLRACDGYRLQPHRRGRHDDAGREHAFPHRDRRPWRLRLRHGGGVHLLGCLQSGLSQATRSKGHPAPLRSCRYLCEDRRHLYPPGHQDGRPRRPSAARRGVGHHRLWRHRQTAVAWASRAHILRALSGPGLGRVERARFAVASGVQPGPHPARRRWLPLYGGRRVSPVGEIALPQRHLARPRFGRFMLSLRGHHRRRRPHRRRLILPHYHAPLRRPITTPHYDWRWPTNRAASRRISALAPKGASNAIASASSTPSRALALSTPSAATRVAFPASLPVALPSRAASPSRSSRSSAIWKARPIRSPNPTSRVRLWASTRPRMAPASHA